MRHAENRLFVISRSTVRSRSSAPKSRGYGKPWPLFLSKVTTGAYILALLLLISPAHAFDLTASIVKSSQDDANFEHVLGVKMTAGNDNVYAFLSADRHKAWTEYVDVLGAGVGVRKRFDNIRLWIDAGVFLPQYDDAPHRLDCGGMAEGVYYWQRRYTGAANPKRVWTYYEWSFDPAFGGEVGVDLFFPVGKNVEIGASASYKVLRLLNSTIGYDSDDWAATGQYYHVEEVKDFGGFRVAAAVNVIW